MKPLLAPRAERQHSRCCRSPSFWIINTCQLQPALPAGTAPSSEPPGPGSDSPRNGGRNKGGKEGRKGGKRRENPPRPLRASRRTSRSLRTRREREGGARATRRRSCDLGLPGRGRGLASREAGKALRGGGTWIPSGGGNCLQERWDMDPLREAGIALRGDKTRSPSLFRDFLILCPF